MEDIFKKLTDLINKYDRFLIATHKDPDFDGMGSAIAMQQILNSFEKENYIVIDDKNLNTSMQKKFKMLSEQKILLNTIETNKALKLISSNTVVIILDTHRKERLEEPRLVDNANVIILDHHIKARDYIKETLLSHIIASFSSTAEIMTEYLKYLKIEIPEPVATILMVGIEIDTNHFRGEINAETYEAVAFLARAGINNIIRQELLQEPKEEYLKRQKVIENSFIVKDNIHIGVVEDICEAKDLALIAEDMIKFKNVEAVFVIGKISKQDAGVSTRSVGRINVKRIMESIGGGGHMYKAAARLKDTSLEEAKKIILKSLGEK